MSLNTFGDLKASIAGWATKDSLTVQIPDFVGWAHQEICRRLRANFMLTSADVAVSAETVALPDRFAALKRLYLDVSPRVFLNVTSAEGAVNLSSQMGTGCYPSHVAVEGSSFRFAPLFSGSATGKCLYYQKPALMVDDTDANAVLQAYPFLYLYGSLEALFRYLEDDNNADRYGQQFGALLEDINAREAKDAMSGPLQVMPARGGIV